MEKKDKSSPLPGSGLFDPAALLGEKSLEFAFEQHFV